MPTLTDILKTGIPAGIDLLDYLQRRSAIGSGQTALTTGLTEAQKQLLEASSRVSGINKDIYGQQQDLLAPYRNIGGLGLTQLTGRLNAGDFTKPFTGADLTNEPGYQFGLNEMIKQLKAQAGARGLLESGGTFRNLLDRTGDYASTKYNEAFNRDLATKQQNYNTLTGIAGIGERATGQAVGAGSEYGNRETVNAATTGQNVAQLQQQIGEALAMGDFARASELSQALGGLSDLFGGNQNGTNLTQLAGGIGGKDLAKIGSAIGTGAATAGKAALTALGAIPVAGQVALGVGAAILAGKKLFGIGDTHEKAIEWTGNKEQGIPGPQNEFDAAMASIGDEERSGELTPEQAAEARSQAVQQYTQLMREYEAKGGDQRTVINRARQTFLQWYGDPSQYGASF